MGTYETKFVIPNLNKEVKRIPVSSVVLSSHRVDLKEAHLQCPEEQRSSRGNEPAGPGGTEADSERDARLQRSCSILPGRRPRSGRLPL